MPPSRLISTEALPSDALKPRKLSGRTISISRIRLRATTASAVSRPPLRATTLMPVSLLPKVAARGPISMMMK